MHNLKTNFDKILNICKEHSKDLFNELGNIPRHGFAPRFSDLEVIALSLTAEALGIDSENLLFVKINAEYREQFPNIISRRQYNDRRKTLRNPTEYLRKCFAHAVEQTEDTFGVDSKPVQVCRLVRKGRNQMGKTTPEKAPDVGFCASQNQFYYGYKLHTVCSYNGVVHSYDLTPASVHDIHYLNDIKFNFSDCVIIGDKAYISQLIQLDLFNTSKIKLEVPLRSNQHQHNKLPYLFKKVRKRCETTFSQLDDQFYLNRNYAKNVNGFFTRIVAKLAALTVLQYINKFINHKPIGRLKHALAA